MVSFQRPIGAAADLQELEYVSALLQTQQSGSGARRDGSVQDVDIQLFLKSRFGIDVSLKDIQRLVIHAFGDGDVIDLSEMTAMLLIPTLIKATATAQEEEEETDDIQYPKPGLIQSVLSMILRDVTGSSKPPKLTVSLLHDILLAYGEESMSNDVDLLREMATFGEVLNEETFSRALTNDVLLYNVNDEATLTTNYRDVMKPIRNEKEEDTVKMSLHDDSDDQDYLLENGKQDLPQTKQAPATIQRFWSSPGIDFTACRYSSKFIVVFLWTGFVISYIAYFGRIVREETSYQFDNVCPPTSNFGCRIMLAIVEWLFILATLCGFGLAYVALSCTGNGIEDTRKWTRVIAIVMIGFWTWFLFLLLYSKEDRTVGEVYSFDEDGNRVYEGDVVLESSQPYEAVVYFLSLIIGNIVILLELYMMFGDTVRRRCFNKASLVKFFTASGIKAEAANKTAAAYKMNALVDNARQIHSYSSKDIDHGETSFGAGLLNFSVRGEEFEEAGGFLWTWTRLFNKDLFQQEGVWISARLLAGNFAQLLISAFVLTYGIAFTRYIIEEWQKGKQDPSRFLYLALERFNVLVQVEDYASTTCNFLTDITNGALNASSILLLSVDNTTCATVAGHAINRTIEGISDSLYPQEQYMVEVPMIVATAVAFISTLALVVVYIPSVASTTLQFRSGVIPLFHDDYNFELYRSRLDNITILLGSMFWSALYAAGFVGILLGTIVFLFLWQATTAFFVNLLAILIGLVSTIIIKILLAVFLLRRAYAAFYRKRVNQVNVVSLSLEAIMVGFAIGTALARAIKLILIAALYIGRVDTPLLAPGVGVGPLMDRYPFIFRQDILALEAHRHPYIDLIGKMYLLKLRHGDRFANRAGYCYRLIFAVALLPWLRKYRVIARPELGDNDGKGGLDRSRIQASLLPRSSILAHSVNLMLDSAILASTPVDNEFST